MKLLSKPFAFLLATMLSVPAFAASPVAGPENVRNLRLLENSPMLFELHSARILLQLKRMRCFTTIMKTVQPFRVMALLKIRLRAWGLPCRWWVAWITAAAKR